MKGDDKGPAINRKRIRGGKRIEWKSWRPRRGGALRNITRVKRKSAEGGGPKNRREISVGGVNSKPSENRTMRDNRDPLTVAATR